MSDIESDQTSKNAIIQQMYEDGHALLMTRRNDKKPTTAWAYDNSVEKIRMIFSAQCPMCEDESPDYGYAIRLGYNEFNERYMIALDFDIKESNKTTDNKYCADTWENYKSTIDNLDGMFNSSTQGNFQVLLDITESTSIREALKNYNNKIVHFGHKNSSMEVLCGGITLLPPSKTVDKRKGKAHLSRKFENENYCLKVYPEDAIEEWFLERIPEGKKKCDSKEKLATESYIKDVREEYQDAVEEADDEKPTPVGLLSKNSNQKVVLKLLDSPVIQKFKNRSQGYDAWYKVVYAIINVFGDEGLEIMLKWSNCANYPRSKYEAHNTELYKQFQGFLAKTNGCYDGFNEFWLLDMIKQVDEQEFMRIAPLIVEEHKEMLYLDTKEHFELNLGWSALRDCKVSSGKGTFLFRHTTKEGNPIVFGDDDTMKHHFFSWDKPNFFKKWFDDAKRAEWWTISANPYELINNAHIGMRRSPITWEKYRDQYKKIMVDSEGNEVTDKKGKPQYYYPDMPLTEREYKTYNVFSDSLKYHIKLLEWERSPNHKLHWEFFKNDYLLKRLCNGQEDACKFLIQWLAYFLFIRKPKICPIFCGKQGSGKSTLAMFIRRWIGKQHVHTSVRPREDVFHRFNRNLLEKMFLCIEEPNWVDFQGVMGMFKNFIVTEEKMPIEGKGEAIFDVVPYITCMIATNNYRLFQNEEGQRRFMFFLTWWEKASKEKNAFWTKLIGLMKTDEFMLDIGSHLKEEIIKDFNFEEEIDKCKTQFHKSQEDLYKNMNTNRFVKHILTTPGVFRSIDGYEIENIFDEDIDKDSTFATCIKHGTKNMLGDDKYYLSITKEGFSALFKQYSGDKHSARSVGLDHDFRVLNDFKVNYKPANKNGGTRKECYYIHPFYLKRKLEELDEWECDLDSDDEGINPDEHSDDDL
jgi:hypothetical protein